MTFHFDVPIGTSFSIQKQSIVQFWLHFSLGFVLTFSVDFKLTGSLI